MAGQSAAVTTQMPNTSAGRVVAASYTQQRPVDGPKGMTRNQRQGLLRKTRTDPGVTVKYQVTNGKDDTFWAVSRTGVSDRMLSAFSTRARADLIQPNNSVWLVPDVSAEVLTKLLNWMRDYCNTTHTAPISIDGLSLEAWLGLWTAATNLGIGLAVEQLRRQLSDDTSRRDTKSWILGWIRASALGLHAPAHQFQNLLHDLVRGKEKKMTPDDMRMFFEMAPDASFTTSAISTKGREIYHKADVDHVKLVKMFPTALQTRFQAVFDECQSNAKANAARRQQQQGQTNRRRKEHQAGPGKPREAKSARRQPAYKVKKEGASQQERKGTAPPA
ncbi:MAG: hypothetical protein M1828_000771 [Chrysothrix sp. TS-e1954]|nr:MAG: hypothetical protein M1828_000771 [Chrysothrix sp. TS-e1954]